MSEFSHSLAVVIGINQYGSGISPLKTPVNDVQEIARILQQEHRYEVMQFLDQEATLQSLQQLMHERLPGHVQPDSRLLFYFAGHGIALNGEDGPEGYLIPQDAAIGDVKTYLPMPELQAALSELPCRHFLGILDCCFAGAFRWSSTRKLVALELGTIHKERYDRFIQDAAWQTITSAAYDQEALDSLAVNSERGQTGNHSPFAAALIEALSGKADLYPPPEPGKPAGDGVITATELYLYLRDRVEPATENRSLRQTPGIWPLKKHDKGEFIFLSPGHVLNLPPAPPLDRSRNPYRGLESFEEAQSDLFFGRQTLTRKLAEFVTHQPFTVVLGASGSGKSSLVKAGLIPKLKQTDAQIVQWHILPPMRPGESPLKALSNTLKSPIPAGFSSSGGAGVPTCPSGSEQPLHPVESTVSDITIPEPGTAIADKTLTQYLAIWSQQHPKAKLLLVIDQVEELITLCRSSTEREQFLHELAQAIRTYPEQLRLVLTLRSDFEPQFQDTVLKQAWSAARFVIPPMTRAELREAIEEPASQRVMYFQSDDPDNPLVDQLINEVAEMPGALPLLSFTLSELYLKYLQRQQQAQEQGESIDRAITEADYKELGGVARSLTQRADQEYELLVEKDPAYEQIIRQVMLRMVAVGGGELARRRVPLAELEYPPAQNDRVKRVIQQFSAARLLVEGIDADEKPYAEPAHDALVRGWQKLLTWKQEEEENLILQRRLTPAAEEWKAVQCQEQASIWRRKAEVMLDLCDREFYRIENVLNQARMKVLRFWKRSQPQEDDLSDQSRQFLWTTNPYLDVLHQQFQSSDRWFNQVESEFVQKSIVQRRKNTSWRWRITAAVILGLSGLTIAALIGQRNAQLGQAQASRQAAEANLLSKQELDALVNALRAGRSLENLLPLGLFQPASDSAQTRQVLQKAIDQNRERNRLDVRKLLEKSQGGILAGLSFSADDRLVATVISSQAIELWDFESQQRLRQFDAATLGSPDGLNPGQIGPDDGRLAAKFSPDSNFLAILIDGSLQLWDMQQQQLVTELPGSEQWEHLSFSPDSKKFLTISQTGAPKLFDLASRQWIPTTIALPQDLTLANITWSSGDQVIFSGFYAGAVYLWDLSRDTLVPETISPEDTATLVLSPDRQLLATIRVGNGQNPPNYELQDLTNSNPTTLIPAFMGYQSLGFNSIIWSQNRQTTATVNAEGIVRLWHFHRPGLAANLPPETASLAHNGKTGKFSDDWDAETQAKLANIKAAIAQKYTAEDWNSGIQNLIENSNLTFSSDNSKVAIVDSWKGRFFSFWDLNTETELSNISEALRGLTGGNRAIEIEDLRFSPDGRFLAIAHASNLRLWDLQNNQWINAPFRGDPDCDSSVQAVAFSPDSQLIATRSNGSVCLRNLSGDQLARFADDGYDTLSFSSDSRFLFTADDSNKITQTWQIESFDELIVHACNLVSDYLNAPSSDAVERDRSLCEGQ